MEIIKMIMFSQLFFYLNFAYFICILFGYLLFKYFSKNKQLLNDPTLINKFLLFLIIILEVLFFCFKLVVISSVNIIFLTKINDTYLVIKGYILTPFKYGYSILTNQVRKLKGYLKTEN